MCAHGGIPHHPFLHERSAQYGAGRSETHAEMMRHHGLNDLAAGAARALRCEVDRLVKAVLAAHSERLQPAQIAHGRPRLYEQRQKGAVGREHQLVVHAAPQRKRRDSVRLVAIAQMLVKRVVSALRRAPGQGGGSAPTLTVDAEFCALPQQRFPHEGQKQLRHQILKHRARPRGHSPIAVLLYLRAAELPP